MQAYDYDRWGNRTINASSWGTGINTVQTSVESNTNRMYAPNDPSHTLIDYDAAGNQTKDYLTWNGTRTFDAENRMITATNGTTDKYTYDADGKRTRRKVGKLETWYVYGLGGELVAEYAPNAPASTPDKEYGYRNGQLLVTAAPVDAALGKTATQKSTFVSGGTTFSAGLAIDGNTNGTFWDLSSATTNYDYQNWWQVDLGTSQLLSSIQVWPRTDCCPEHTANFYVIVSDNAFTSTDLTTTLNQPGVSSYWVAGNNAIVATIAVNRTARYVRVQRNDSQYLVLAEVKVWQTTADVEWLVTDHLGTPRMITDSTGSLTGIKRHDYLPFGEELTANQGGRTTLQGYSINDGTRQKFTSKERDNETGLDYFGARYFASTQGRFTSADPAMVSLARMVDPQQLNLYSYVRNKPLSLIDPDGREIWILFEDTNAKGKHFTNRVRYSDGKLYTKDGKEYTGNNSYALKVQNGLNKLAKSGDDVLQTRIQVLTNSKNIHNIQLTPEDGKGDRNRPNSEKKDREGKPTGTTTFFNPDSTKDVRGEDAPPVSTLAHELLGHGFDSDQGETDHDKTPNGIPMSEVNAVNIENRARATIGAPIKNSYGGKPIPDQLLYDPYRRRP
jgi:RHS repeat-associated protein